MQLAASVVLEANRVRMLPARQKSLCGQSDIQACRQDTWPRNMSMFSWKYSSFFEPLAQN